MEWTALWLALLSAIEHSSFDRVDDTEYTTEQYEYAKKKKKKKKRNHEVFEKKIRLLQEYRGVLELTRLLKKLDSTIQWK